jgi:protein-histidine N-methyltransferase
MSRPSQQALPQLSFVVADYNPTVLQLVTLPNLILVWALSHQQDPALQDAFTIEGELELFPSVLGAFQNFLLERHIDLSFVSGGWSQEFILLLYGIPTFTAQEPSSSPVTILLGAETIYSPFALQAFAETVLAILSREHEVPGATAAAYVAAKRLYFGVGGSLDDFIQKAEQKGSIVTQLREETEGVRRGVVRCLLQHR